MSIGSRIKQRREELGLTQPQLAELVGVTKGSIGNYESNVSAPNEKILFKLFTVLQCDANFLYQDNITELSEKTYISIKDKENIKKYRTLDEYGKRMVDLVLNEEYARCAAEVEEEQSTIKIQHSTYKVSAGRGFDLEDRDSWEEIDIPDTPEARNATFAVTIVGDSMEPIYSDGQIVLVKEQSAVDIGETGIYIINGGGFIKRNGGDHLISINPQYDDIYFSEGDTVYCAGKVIGTV